MAKNIEQFRAEFPQYDSINDADLADKLYSKYYDGKLARTEFDQKFLDAQPKHGIDDYLKANPELANESRQDVADFVFDTQFKGQDIPRSEFDEFFMGLKPEDKESSNYLIRGAKNASRSVISKASEAYESVSNALSDAVRGDAEFDVPNVQSMAAQGTVKAAYSPSVASAAIFGDDKDYVRAVREANPDLKIIEDKNGNSYVVDDNGDKFAINSSGLDVEDITRFGGKIAAFYPGAILTGLARSTGKRVLAGAGSAGTTDATMQALADRDELDGKQLALSTVAGGAGEVLGPMVGRSIEAIRKRIGKNAWSKMKPSQQQKVINRQLTKDGFKPDDFAGMSKREIVDFARERIGADEALHPDVGLAERFGYQLDRGTAMPVGTVEQRAARTEQLNIQEGLKTSSRGQRLLDIDNNNVKQHETNVNAFANMVTDGAPSGSRNAAAQRSHELLLEAENASKKNYRAAFKEAESKKGAFDDEVILGLPDRMLQRLRDSNVIVGDSKSPMKSRTPGALSIVEEIKTYPETSIKGVENIRKKINAAYADSAGNLPDRRAIKVLKDEYDIAMREAMDNQLFTGDHDAIETYRKATGLYAEHKNKFGGSDEIGRMVEKLLEPDRTPEDVAKYLFGTTGVSRSDAARLSRRYLAAVKDNPEAKNALRETFIHSIMRTGKDTEAKGIDAMIGSLKEATDGKGQSLTQTLFDKKEIAQLKQFARALRLIQTDARRKNPSGTAAGVGRIVDGLLGGGRWRDLPFMSKALGLLDDAKMSAEVRKAMRLPDAKFNAEPVSLAPIAGALNTQ